MALGKLLFLSGPMATPFSAQEQSFPHLFDTNTERQGKPFLSILPFLGVSRGQDRVAVGKVNYQQWVKTIERCRRFVFCGFFLEGVVVGGHTDRHRRQ